MYVPTPELLRYIGHNELKKKDIITFLMDAQGDDALVKRAIDRADEEENIKSYVGWIRRCIQRGGYDDNIPVEKGSSEDARRARDIKENIESQSEIHASDYWRKLKAKKGGKFNEFEAFVEQNGMDLEMFEAANTEAECAEKYFKWYKGKKIELI